MTRTRFTLPFATLGGEPTNSEWFRQVSLGKIIQEGNNVSLPISLQDLDRGFTTVPNILYDSLHPPVDRGYSAVKIQHNLSFTDAGLSHTHQLPRDIREGMLASFIKNNPSSAEIIKSLVTI